MNKTNSENESVSGKSFKKKLQEELFAQSNGVADEKVQFQHKNRKRKLTKEPLESEQVGSPKKKKIKREPESDIDVSTKFKANGYNCSKSYDSYDESHLNFQVKDEQHFAAPSTNKKKKNRNKSIDNSAILSDELYETTNKKNERKSMKHSSEETEFEDDKLNELVQQENEYHERKTKKKKKKSKRRKDSTMSDEIEHQQRQIEAVAARVSPTRESESNGTILVETAQQKEKIKNKKRLSKSSIADPADCIDKDAHGRKQKVDAPVNRSVSFINLTETVKRTPRISERIRFEEDECSDVDTNQLQNSNTSAKSSKLKTFLEENFNLKPFTSELNTRSVLTDDDEIWIVTCPKEVDVDAFENKEFTIEGKCKIKLSGQTYEGTVDNESGNRSILSSEQSSYVIKNLRIKGCLNFHKRIPKSHIQDDVMVNNQTNFIPLPETKCRHPLFGTGYRKAIKLPASVTERLQAPPEPRAARHKNKRSQKERKAYSQESSDPFVSSTKAEFSPESSVKPEVESDQTQTVSAEKKKKKKKHSTGAEAAPREKKRIKHNLDSAEAWESEQAIEENLFNF